MKKWHDMNGSERIVIVLILGVIFWVIVGIGVSGSESKTDKPAKTETVKPEKNLSDKVKEALDNLGKDTTNVLVSVDGYQGEIESVKPAIEDGTVKVNISTYFEDPESGKRIATNLFSNVCLDVPELDSMYVVSGSGLESKSVYRHDIPACNQ